MADLKRWAKTMDLLDWIAASKELRFVADRDEADVRARFAEFRTRGFITDFTDLPVVAEKKGGKIMLSRKSSFFGRSGIRCVVRVLPKQSGCSLHVRLWHEPLLTAWFCISYGLAAIVVLASIGAFFLQSGHTEGVATLVAGAVAAAVWAVVTGAFNALMRVQQKARLDEFTAILFSIAKEDPNQ
ncbi:MAG: hypothetical protein HZA32_03790 [Opitutae bacterium]|nr:hypothetical protein [Opitutae bacterium]